MGPADESAILNPMAERLLAEIRRSLEFYATQEGGGQVGRIVVSGGTSHLTGITEFLQARLNIPVVRVNPFEGVKGADDLGPAFHAVFGLSLAGIGAASIGANLVPPDILLRRRARRAARELTIAGLLAAALVAEVGWVGWSLYTERRDFLRRLEEKIESPAEVGGQPLLTADGTPIRYSEALSQVTAFEEEQEKLRARLAAIKDLEAEKARWLDVLEELRRVLPENTWITGGINLSKAGFALSLQTTVNGEHRRFFDDLGRSALLTNRSSSMSTSQPQPGLWAWAADVGIRWRAQEEDAGGP